MPGRGSPERLPDERALAEPSVAAAAASVAALRARMAASVAGTRPTSPDERAALRTEIAALIRAADAALDGWRAVADAARALPELWKQLPTSAVPNAMRATTSRGTTARSDHLGASTFVARGWTAYAAGDFSAAETAFERALTLAPDEAEATALLAWTRASQGRGDDALVAAQHVLVTRAAGAAASLARVAVGRVCLEKGIEGEAVEHLARVIRDNDDRRATLYATLYLGLAYQRRGMLDDSAAFLRRALALGPNLIEARYALGCTLWRAGARDGAREEWRAGAAGAFGPWARRCEERLTELDSDREVRA